MLLSVNAGARGVLGIAVSLRLCVARLPEKAETLSAAPVCRRLGRAPMGECYASAFKGLHLEGCARGGICPRREVPTMVGCAHKDLRQFRIVVGRLSEVAAEVESHKEASFPQHPPIIIFPSIWRIE